MSSIGVKLPIQKDSSNGFTTIKSIKEMFNQNLKMLILTIPGERIMDPEFGVGAQQYLFYGFNEGAQIKLDNSIREQVATYLPAIRILDILFAQVDPGSNTLSFRIEYSIPDAGIKDLLEFTI
tara:strand:- start:2012 stop:2380 length:369 start_codon:yes stop_codon:yes gene_type:complete